MKLYGHAFDLEQQKKYLRLSTLAWLLWLALVVPLCRIFASDMIASSAWVLTGFALLPLLLLLPWVWRGKNGSMLIFVGMIWLLYLGLAVLSILKGGLSIWLFSVESVLILNALYWLMWVIERMPKLHANR